MKKIKQFKDSSRLKSETHLYQQSLIISATNGSTMGGISRCLSWNPTAPTTCIEFISVQGTRRVASSHSMTPKLYISDLPIRKVKLIGEIKSQHPERVNILSRIQSTGRQLTYFSFDGSLLSTSGAIHSAYTLNGNTH